MAFETGVKTIAQLVNHLPDTLVASHASWTAAGGSWTGSESDSGYGTNHWIRKACKVNRDGEELWFAFEVPWHPVYGLSHAYTGFPYSCYSTDCGLIYYHTGILMTISDAWSDGPSGNYQRCLGYCHYTHGSAVSFQDMDCQYWMWNDATGEAAAGNGLCTIIKPTSSYYMTPFINIERCAPEDKQYSDGYSNWWMHSVPNYRHTSYDDFYKSEHEHGYILHPFSDAWPSLPRGYYDSPQAYHRGSDVMKDCPDTDWRHMKGLSSLYGGYRSVGIGKIYFQYPWYMANVKGYDDTFQLQSRHWFGLCENDGITDGDVIAISGDTAKYVALYKTSVGSSTPHRIAMRYVE
jgi:hypothetical protein